MKQVTQDKKVTQAKEGGGESLFRLWVDTERQVVSFHEVEGSRLLEFSSRELFLHCIDQYTNLRYRYQ